jgi:mono/diheme cytochrome c family protein
MRLPRRKTFLYAVIGLLVLLAAAITATIGWRPFIGPRARAVTDRTFAPTPERMERGRYLVRAVTGCLICHSNVDAGVAVPSEEAMNGAGKVWEPEGLPWLVAPNLTPDRETGAGGWSDDTIARAVREGIGHDGRTLFPLMPYLQYRGMSDEDLASIVVYLRSLPAVRNPLPRTEVPFPPGPLINGLPQPIDAPVPQPDLSDPVKRGEYLVRLGACTDCHTPMDAQGNQIPGMAFAGGFVLRHGNGQVTSANLTPDPSGIPYYTEELFLTTMRTGRVISRKISDVMPWWAARNQTDDDLRAMFAYLKTLTPVAHRVDNTLPPSECPVCGLTHAGGDRNRRSN